MIILTEKDADWMANICREKLNGAELSYHEAFMKMNKLKEVSDSFMDDVSEEEREAHLDEINENFAVAKSRLEGDWNKIKSDYTKMINLLTCGSNYLGE